MNYKYYGTSQITQWYKEMAQGHKEIVQGLKEIIQGHLLNQSGAEIKDE